MIIIDKFKNLFIYFYLQDPKEHLRLASASPTSTTRINHEMYLNQAPKKFNNEFDAQTRTSYDTFVSTTPFYEENNYEEELERFDNMYDTQTVSSSSDLVSTIPFNEQNYDNFVPDSQTEQASISKVFDDNHDKKELNGLNNYYVSETTVTPVDGYSSSSQTNINDFTPTKISVLTGQTDDYVNDNGIERLSKTDETEYPGRTTQYIAEDQTTETSFLVQKSLPIKDRSFRYKDNEEEKILSGRSHSDIDLDEQKTFSNVDALFQDTKEQAFLDATNDYGDDEYINLPESYLQAPQSTTNDSPMVNNRMTNQKLQNYDKHASNFAVSETISPETNATSNDQSYIMGFLNDIF